MVYLYLWQNFQNYSNVMMQCSDDDGCGSVAFHEYLFDEHGWIYHDLGAQWTEQ